MSDKWGGISLNQFIATIRGRQFRLITINFEWFLPIRGNGYVSNVGKIYIYISKEIGVEYLIEYLIQEFYPPV